MSLWDRQNIKMVTSRLMLVSYCHDSKLSPIYILKTMERKFLLFLSSKVQNESRYRLSWILLEAAREKSCFAYPVWMNLCTPGLWVPETQIILLNFYNLTLITGYENKDTGKPKYQTNKTFPPNQSILLSILLEIYFAFVLLHQKFAYIAFLSVFGLLSFTL